MRQTLQFSGKRCHSDLFLSKVTRFSYCALEMSPLPNAIPKNLENCAHFHPRCKYNLAINVNVLRRLKIRARPWGMTLIKLEHNQGQAISLTPQLLCIAVFYCVAFSFA